ncbi:hypothetical protein [Kitasatospora sp. CB01950]|uniref:hypothetical protein n=1 Tax=Kitasatospora sp. CB01950 TaxID=1703930 RepID=UPI000938BB9B|nr:hypothetical protein [Kitasatospora sp. CB01950]OKJ06835.1 hypothetical protein AMK19_23615 [Kitasatospora sp. CB01950]
MADLLQWREGRFEARQLPPNERSVVLWAVWDTDTDGWVRDEGRPPSWWDRDGADGWIRRQRSLTDRPSATWWKA